MNDAKDKNKKIRGKIKKIVRVEIKNGKRTEKELSEEEIKEWIIAHKENAGTES